ncbi:hybrid sensor histidine kinase/response regulator transcription factor [Marinoscillum furvescens]|uniref:histidine kinase n=1 Tax=Marinoscillum furvescens DSM 4134 TaxID=1122208 RepID=A0A3D9L3I8_MARFU|nr:two-component regulator propeller domain-containing protein [Marinoscillum furvescens]RED97931.1 signal transduction histidine kinase [Marinoscillum furvescens DSM 4134]
MRPILQKILVQFFVLLAIVCHGQHSQIRFEHLDSKDGLSHNRINSIYQDQLGFIWFGTPSGLNRYDGSMIKVFEPDEDNQFALSNPNIFWMKEGPEGHMWIKPNYGVFAYDVFQERFINIQDLIIQLRIDDYNLTDLIKDEHGNYWFIIENLGVKTYLSDQDTIYHYGGAYRDVVSAALDGKGNIALTHMNGSIELIDTGDPQKTTFIKYPEHLQGKSELKTFIDNAGDFWFYSEAYPFGACRFSPETSSCKHYDADVLGSTLVSGIIQDQAGRVIIGVDHGGLTIIDDQQQTIQSIRNNTSDPNSLSINSVISIYKDKSELVWIGTNKGGVNYFSPKSVNFNFYKNVDARSPKANDLLAIMQADEHTLWLGSDGAGLHRFDRRSGSFTTYRHDPQDPHSLSSDIVVSLSPAADGGIWMGTYMGGLNYFDGQKFTTYRHQKDDPNSPSGDSVWKLYLDSKNRLWLGTLKGGVNVYDSAFQKIYEFNRENGTIKSNYATSFSEDRSGRMWVGTGYGIEIFHPETQTFSHILQDESKEGSLSNNSVLDIYCASDGTMWVGTMYGLNRFDKDKQQFETFTKEDGLPDNIISSILEDDSGDMWFGTFKGLSKLTITDDSLRIFENFDLSDGLQGEMFNERSALKLQSGHLAFGGSNGLNIFDPEQVQFTNEENKLVFLDFYISNHRIRSGEWYNGREWFADGLNQTSAITLKHFENSFTIEFTALNYYQNENTVYKYRLKGFDDQWVTDPNIHRVNYTNLDPGRYTFEVMATDQSHMWSGETKTLNITVLAPFWETPLAYVIYMFVFALALIFTRRVIINKERFRAKVAQEQLEAKRLHELDLMKIKFFTNISHEFRTPLTLILTPIERLMKSTEDEAKKVHYELIHRNARRLLNLVNQLLDFRKMEANQHRLSLASGDIIAFMKSIVDSFTDLSSERHIHLSFESSVPQFFTRFDRDKLEKVMFNLLSNAFKFTHPQGKVAVEIDEVAQKEGVHTIRFAVRDTGIGIPQERKAQVFNRFFQVDNASFNLNHGSGIGLSISKEFVEMHHGEIWVESEVEKGSKFIFELPLKRLLEHREEIETTQIVNSQESVIEPEVHQENCPTILLADDNEDFRFYLRDNLKALYNIYEAPNGKEAWKLAMDKQPDLVVTDIMMPVMTGIELCQKIKRDPRTGHIPVILLTAHYSDDQKLEGFEAGATEYITKPFNFEILIQGIKSAIQLQKQIHASEHRIVAKPSEIAIKSLDEKFIEKAIAIVEENISNANFSVQELSRELAVSRGQLYKKTLEITGKSPIEFIRLIRLKRAAALLEKSQLSVAEVAYKVGFNNPKYFTKYFKQEYKVLPSKYAQSLDRQDT